MAAYQPNGVVFDGTTYLRRAAQFTSEADSVRFTAAFSVIVTGAATDQHIISCDQTIHNGYPALLIGRRVTTNAIYMYGANTTTANLSIIGSIPCTTTWHNVLISIDQSDTAKRHLYVDEVSDLVTIATYNNVARDFTNPENTVGAIATDYGLKLVGELADVWFDIDRYVDFSVEANRRLFFNADGSVVDKGPDGSVPFAAAPTLFLSGTLPTWPTNKGSGGGMTVGAGALTRSSVLPAAPAGVQTLVPTSIEAVTNLTGAVTTVDEAVDGPDANWLTATSAVAGIDVRVSFGTPA